MGKPWPLKRELHYKRKVWGWSMSVRRRLGQRRRWPRTFYNRRPLAHRWGHWKLAGIEYGSGGPYSEDFYYVLRRFLPCLRRQEGKRVYSAYAMELDDYEL